MSVKIDFYNFELDTVSKLVHFFWDTVSQLRLLCWL